MNRFQIDEMARALGGYRAGHSWMCRCPAHDDCTPSLSVALTAEGRILVHCHAGCSQSDVIAALRGKGWWHAGNTDASSHATRQFASVGDRSEVDIRRRTAQALRIWCETVEAKGTLLERYLATRGLTLASPKTVRFHPRLKHRSGGCWPAMVALVSAGIDDRPIGVHRTFLARDGTGKAPVDQPKMMLGKCHGGAIRLAPLARPLLIGEGIETCLSAVQSTGQAAWAALSTSGLRTLELPAEATSIIILADGDEPGRAAARDAARRWRKEGRFVRIAAAPEGKDFNDLLSVRTPDCKEEAP